jgi:hypothetical protein
MRSLNSQSSANSYLKTFLATPATTRYYSETDFEIKCTSTIHDQWMSELTNYKLEKPNCLKWLRGLLTRKTLPSDICLRDARSSMTKFTVYAHTCPEGQLH